MGKKSRRHARNKPKRSEEEIFLAGLNLPIPLPVDAASPPRDHRQLADYCLENFPLLDKQDETRFVLFPNYISLLQEIFEQDVEDAWNKGHIKFLRKTAHDEADLTYFRVVCLFSLLLRYVHMSDYEGIIDYCEKIVRLCKNASELEKSRRLPGGLLVGEDMAEKQRHAESVIDKAYIEMAVPVFRSPTETIRVPLSAGSQCDNCQKTKAELGVERLSCCTRCQFEYYCSKDCQLSAWKNGHKQRCRASDEFHLGDQALCCPQSPERVQLVERLEEDDSWVVVGFCGKNQRTVPTKDLRRLRPAMWHCPEAYKSNFKTG